MNRIITSFVMLFVCYYANAQMSGTYTIGGSSPNFTTVVQAVDSLNAQGVNGAVIFNIRQGTYYGKVKIDTVNGTSAVNTVLFQPDTGNTAAVNIIDSVSTVGSAGSRGAWVISNSSYITLKNLGIYSQKIKGCGVEFTGVCEYLTIDSCVVEMDSVSRFSTSSSRRYESVIVAEQNDNDTINNITISNCKISGGVSGIYANGGGQRSWNVPTRNYRNWIVENNTINGFYYYGIQLTGTSCEIKGNTILNRQTGAWLGAIGINIYKADTFKILSNHINMVGGSVSSGTGIYINENRQLYKGSVRSLVANNMVFVDDANAVARLLIIEHVDFINNTFVSGSVQPSIAVVQLSGDSLQFKNNICYNSTGGKAFVQGGVGIVRGSNCFYSSGIATDVTLLGSEHMLNPNFVSNRDFHATSAVVNGNGIPYAGITEDIDGDARGTNPDIGADEFTPTSLDLELVSIEDLFCTGSQSINVAVVNNGVANATNWKMNWAVSANGGTPVMQTAYTSTTSIASGTATNFTLGTYNFSSDSTYAIHVYVDSVNLQRDNVSGNDTLSSRTFRTSLNGTYTVGGLNADFATPDSAAQYINAYGICGPVTFQVRSGTYSPIAIVDVPGNSTTNTITFEMDNSATTQPIIEGTSTAWGVGVHILQNVSGLTFKNLTFKSTSRVGPALQFVGINDMITIDSCRIEVNTTSTSSGVDGIGKKSGSGIRRITNMSISNTEFVGGSTSIDLVGTSVATEYDSNFVVENCKFSSFRHGAFYLANNTNSVIKNNNISNGGSLTNSVRGIYANRTPKIQIIKNSIKLVSGSSNVGITVRFNSHGDSAGVRTTVINNMISLLNDGTNTRGQLVGISFESSSHADVFHNSVYVEGERELCKGADIRKTTATDMNFRNNAIKVSGKGVVLLSRDSVNTSNNALYGTKDVSVYDGVAYNSGNDVLVDPVFVARDDLHAQSILLNAAGANLNVTTDYDGDTRGTTPDIGADEFTPVSNDITPVTILGLNDYDCGSLATPMEIVVLNNGTSSQSSIPVTLILSGQVNDTITATSTATVGSAQNDTISMGNINVEAGGLLSVTLLSSLSGDQITGNDTAVVGEYFLHKAPTAPFIDSNVMVCANIDSVLVANSTGDVIHWYDNPMGSPIHSGDSMKVNMAVADTLWLQASNDSKVQTGAQDLTISSSAQYWKPTLDRGLKFDVFHYATLDSVAIYPDTSGNVIVELQNKNGTVLELDTFAVPDVNRHYLNLNYSLAPGKDYALFVKLGTDIELGFNRGSGVRNGYPFTDADTAITIKTTATNSTWDYFFFYEWNISVDDCESDLIMVPIQAVSSLSFDLGTDTSYCIGSPINVTLGDTITGAAAYKWQDGSTNATFNATTKGVYWQEVTSITGCVSRDTLTVIEAALPNVTFNGMQACENSGPVAVSGNPTGGSATGTGTANGLFDPASVGLGNHVVTYTYTDSIGCSNSATDTVTVLAPPMVTLAADTLCESNTAVQLSGGMPMNGYYYGANVQGNKMVPSTIGIDTISYVFVAINGCQDTATSTVEVAPTPVITWMAMADMCSNEGVVSLMATPAGGVYAGNGIVGTDFDPATAGIGSHGMSYSYSNSFGCSDMDSNNITVLEAPTVDLGADTMLCGHYEVELDAQNPQAQSIVWSTGDSAKQAIRVSQAGTYSVLITAMNGCSETDTVEVSHTGEYCVGIDDNFLETGKVKVYPNPSNGILNVEFDQFDGLDVTISVFTVNGQEVLSLNQVIDASNQVEVLDLNQLRVGMYLIKVETNNRSEVFRVTLNK